MTRRAHRGYSRLEEDAIKTGAGDTRSHRDPALPAKTVEIEEYTRVKDLLARSDRDYGRMVLARQVLESKLRHYKDMTEQWRKYTERWILKHPKEQRESLDVPQRLPSAPMRDPRSSSAPAPPSLPENMTPGPSDLSRPISSGTEVMGDGSQRGNPPSSHSRISKSLLGDNIATQLAVMIDGGLGSEDSTKASEKPKSSPQSTTNSGNSGDRVPLHGFSLDPAPRNEDNDDSPIIISERSLKRKRPFNAFEDAGPSKRRSLKDEQISSSPIVAQTSLQGCLPPDSLDLDDVGAHIGTPRKQRRMEQIRMRPSLMFSRLIQDKEGISEGINRQNPQRTYEDVQGHDGDLREGIGARVRMPEEDGKRIIAPKKQGDLRKASSRAQQQAHNNRVHERLGDLAQPSATEEVAKKSKNTSRSLGSDPQHCTPQGPQGKDHRSVALASPTILQPTDPNTHILPRTNGNPSKQRKNRAAYGRDHGAAYVSALAEDGEESASTAKKAAGKQFGQTISPDKSLTTRDAQDRLWKLMDGPSPEKSSLDLKVDRPVTSDKSKSPKAPAARSNCRNNSKTPLKSPGMPAQRPIPEPTAIGSIGLAPSMNEENAPTQAPSRISMQNRTPGNAPPTDQPTDVLPEQEPFRSRPIHRQRTDHFKLNSSHSDYAFHESIRRHDEKKRVSGCTDRNCLRCKDIRKFVENGGYATNMPGQETEETDRRLIEDFLGGDRRRMNKISTEEKAEILAQAKMQQFADKFGTHKTRFARPPSPVDYWNVDFPSTQEHERNREAARIREREKVEEMYWEAMRKGGRYVFADE